MQTSQDLLTNLQSAFDSDPLIPRLCLKPLILLNSNLFNTLNFNSLTNNSTDDYSSKKANKNFYRSVFFILLKSFNADSPHLISVSCSCILDLIKRFEFDEKFMATQGFIKLTNEFSTNNNSKKFKPNKNLESKMRYAIFNCSLKEMEGESFNNYYVLHNKNITDRGIVIVRNILHNNNIKNIDDRYYKSLFKNVNNINKLSSNEFLNSVSLICEILMQNNTKNVDIFNALLNKRRSGLEGLGQLRLVYTLLLSNSSDSENYITKLISFLNIHNNKDYIVLDALKLINDLHKNNRFNMSSQQKQIMQKNIQSIMQAINIHNLGFSADFFVFCLLLEKILLLPFFFDFELGVEQKNILDKINSILDTRQLNNTKTQKLKNIKIKMLAGVKDIKKIRELLDDNEINEEIFNVLHKFLSSNSENINNTNKSEESEEFITETLLRVFNNLFSCNTSTKKLQKLRLASLNFYNKILHNPSFNSLNPHILSLLLNYIEDSDNKVLTSNIITLIGNLISITNINTDINNTISNTNINNKIIMKIINRVMLENDENVRISAMQCIKNINRKNFDVELFNKIIEKNIDKNVKLEEKIEEEQILTKTLYKITPVKMLTINKNTPTMSMYKEIEFDNSLTNSSTNSCTKLNFSLSKKEFNNLSESEILLTINSYNLILTIIVDEEEFEYSITEKSESVRNLNEKFEFEIKFEKNLTNAIFYGKLKFELTDGEETEKEELEIEEFKFTVFDHIFTNSNINNNKISNKNKICETLKVEKNENIKNSQQLEKILFELFGTNKIQKVDGRNCFEGYFEGREYVRFFYSITENEREIQCDVEVEGEKEIISRCVDALLNN